MNPIDQGAAGFLVEAVLLREQRFRLGLDTGQRCLQLVRHHRDKIGADLVDLLQPLDPFFFQGLAAARLVELGGTLDRGAQGAVQPGPDITDQQAGNQGDEEEQEHAADHEARRRRDRREARKTADQHVQHGHDHRGGERARKPESNGRGDDQQIEEEREIGRSAVPA